jgi:hypothetical protein
MAHPFLSSPAKWSVILSLEGRVSFMTLKNLAEAAEEAVTRLIDEENAIASPGADSYSRTVFLAFDKIRALRERRVSFARICGSFEISGMLPENASPHSFRQAYAREMARRNKAGNETAKRTPAPPVNPIGPDRARKPDDTPVKAKPGRVIKNVDGSFEYS